MIMDYTAAGSFVYSEPTENDKNLALIAPPSFNLRKIDRKNPYIKHRQQHNKYIIMGEY